jgi:two-component system sensor histidine kinase QseC
MSSLHRRLLLILIGLFALVWFAAFAGTYAAAMRRLELMFDVQLAHDAGVLLTLVESGLHEVHGPLGPPHEIVLGQRRFRKVLAFRVWRGERVILHSQNAPEVHPLEQNGYANLVVDEGDWRGYTLRGPEAGLAVWVGEPVALRAQLAREIAREELYPLLPGIPLLALLLWWGIKQGLLPLRRIAAEVAQRSPSNLRPVDPQEVPAEVNAIVERLNALLARLREAFERERRFTSDAAHEIRTPLAGIKTHAQVALRTNDAAQRSREVEQVIQDVDRTTHLVDQLLTLARLDREALTENYSAVDLHSLVEDVIARLRTEAEARRIALALSREPAAPVRGNSAMLGALIRNLVDNAVRYTPAGGCVEIGLALRGDATILTVTDNGPGIPAGERARVFDRFYRGSTANAKGCGLGLSIVKRVAELHQAVVELADAPGGQGLQVRVTFPRVNPGAAPDAGVSALHTT